MAGGARDVDDRTGRRAVTIDDGDSGSADGEIRAYLCM